jgi:hypothetical protein
MARRNNGMSYTFDIIVYDNDQFVDLRSLSPEQAVQLKKNIENVFKNPLYDRMTKIVNITPLVRTGELGLDTENDDPAVKTFLDFWTSPRIMRINESTIVRFDLMDITPY